MFDSCKRTSWNCMKLYLIVNLNRCCVMWSESWSIYQKEDPRREPTFRSRSCGLLAFEVGSASWMSSELDFKGQGGGDISCFGSWGSQACWPLLQCLVYLLACMTWRRCEWVLASWELRKQNPKRNIATSMVHDDTLKTFRFDMFVGVFRSSWVLPSIVLFQVFVWPVHYSHLTF